MIEEDDLDSKEASATVGQTLVGAGVVFTLLLGLVLAALPAARKLLWTAEAAAWTLAIGSIAAIATAVWLARAQVERIARICGSCQACAEAPRGEPPADSVLPRSRS